MNTATASSPRLCALRITLLAISPLLAIRMRVFSEWPVGQRFGEGQKFHLGKPCCSSPEGTLTC